jgi:hypothetical protein
VSRLSSGSWISSGRFVLRLGVIFVRITHRTPTPVVLAMRWAWGNRDWSASVGYCRAVVAEARQSGGCVLEAGSGLTTLLLAAVGVEVVALEHDAFWAELVSRSVRWSKKATVLSRPLVHYGSFDLYVDERSELPDATLIVCDGPPGTTFGGRYGLMPVVKPQKGTAILLDDADRDSERETLTKWEREDGVTVEMVLAERA